MFVSKCDPGSMSDITALYESDLVAYLEDDEIILADKGYQGHPRCLTPFKGCDITPEEAAFNDILATARILVECVIRRVKIFGALSSAGKFRINDNSKHEQLFNVGCQISNISFELEPVWLIKNFFLPI